MSGRRAAAMAAAVVIAGALVLAGVLLSHPAPRLAGADDVRAIGEGVALAPGHQICQSGESVPADAATLTLGVHPQGAHGPELRAAFGDRVVRVPGGYGAGDLRVPVPRGIAGPQRVCLTNIGAGPVDVAGQTAAVAIPPGIAVQVDGRVQPLALQLRWMTAPRSGWNAIGPALERWGYVTALGAATPYVAIALFALAFGGAVALAVRGRATALACGAIAFAACAGWALTTPAFQVPDEPQHVAYLQRLAESGRLPTRDPGPVFSPEEGYLFAMVGFNQVVGNPAAGRPPWTAATDRQIDRTIGRLSRFTQGGVSNTTNNPPLYYAAELVPYWAATAAGGNFLDRLLALRLGSALLVGLAVAFAFAFVRELLPRSPWAWTAGALAFGVAPLLGFIGGGVNNDAGLYAAAAALLWLVARALRHGLDRRTAIGIGLATGAGLVTKPTMIGFAPGLLVLAVVLLARADGSQRRALVSRILLAAGIAAVPVAAYLLGNTLLWHRALWGSGASGAVVSVTSGGPGAGHAPQLREFVSYFWQFYLPRLPFMTDQQAGVPLYNVWFEGFIGRFGWLDTTWPGAVYSVAVGVFAVVLGLAAAGAWRLRDTLRRRIGAVLVFGVLTVGFLAVVNWAGYVGRLDSGLRFEQARYLLPLGALYAALIGLAVRGAGRFGRPAGAALVALACAHAAFAVALVVSRFYV